MYMLKIYWHFGYGKDNDAVFENDDTGTYENDDKRVDVQITILVD